MRRIKLFVIGLVSVLSISSALALSPAVSAQFDPFKDVCTSNPDATVCQEQKKTENPLFGQDGIITKIAGILSIVVGIAAVIVIIIAGIQYMVAAGDANKITSAKNAILYAVVGLVIAGASQLIVRFIIARLG